MDRQEFETQLQTDTQIEAKTLQSRPANDQHGHAFAVRGLVLAGTFTVSQNGIPKTYRTGEFLGCSGV